MLHASRSTWRAHLSRHARGAKGSKRLLPAKMTQSRDSPPLQCVPLWPQAPRAAVARRRKDQKIPAGGRRLQVSARLANLPAATMSQLFLALALLLGSTDAVCRDCTLPINFDLGPQPRAQHTVPRAAHLPCARSLRTLLFIPLAAVLAFSRFAQGATRGPAPDTPPRVARARRVRP